MKKSIISLVIVIAVLFSIATPVFAENDLTNTYTSNIIYLDNGDYVVITVDEYFTSKSTTKTGNKHYNYYNANDVLRWKVTLTGTFSYTYGVSSTCTKASHSVTIYDDSWSTDSAVSYKSGDAAYADVTMNQRLLGIVVYQKDVHLALTCDKYGNLS